MRPCVVLLCSFLLLAVGNGASALQTAQPGATTTSSKPAAAAPSAAQAKAPQTSAPEITSPSVVTDSQPPPPAPTPPVPLLWKVSDADNAVYLLGSFHLLEPDDYPLSPDVDAAFADAKQVLFEMPPSEMQSPTLALQMGQAALRTDGTTLDSELTPETASKLKAWAATNADQLGKSGLNAQVLQRFEPWFVGLLVSIGDMTRFGLDPKLGLDEHFAQAAQQAGKQTGGFETGAQQIAFLDGMDKAEQQQFLAEALDDSGDSSQIESLHDAWRRGDADTLWNEMGRDMQQHYPQLFQHIDVERNAAWLPRLDSLLRDGHAGDDTLVVVGSLHLLGNDGLVERLRAQGYTVERICSACAAQSGNPNPNEVQTQGARSGSQSHD